MRTALFVGTLCPLLIALAPLCAAQSNSPLTAPGVQNDAVYTPGFDCGSLAAPQARLECKTYQQNMLNNPPGPATPAIPLPGQPNAIDNAPRNTPNQSQGAGVKGSGAGIDN
jgi:hypothetical protein